MAKKKEFKCFKTNWQTCLTVSSVWRQLAFEIWDRWFDSWCLCDFWSQLSEGKSLNVSQTAATAQSRWLRLLESCWDVFPPRVRSPDGFKVQHPQWRIKPSEKWGSTASGCVAQAAKEIPVNSEVVGSNLLAASEFWKCNTMKKSVNHWESCSGSAGCSSEGKTGA